MEVEKQYNPEQAERDYLACKAARRAEIDRILKYGDVEDLREFNRKYNEQCKFQRLHW